MKGFIEISSENEEMVSGHKGREKGIEVADELFPGIGSKLCFTKNAPLLRVTCLRANTLDVLIAYLITGNDGEDSTMLDIEVS